MSMENLAIATADGAVPDWRDEALCAQIGPDDEVWFQKPGGSPKIAKLICCRCFARRSCLEFALDERIEFGVFGGLTPRERQAEALRRQLPGRGFGVAA